MKRMWLVLFPLLSWAAVPSAFLLNPECDDVSYVGTSYSLIAFSLESDVTFTWTVSDGRVLEGSPVGLVKNEVGFLEVSLVATNTAGESSAPQRRLIYFTDSSQFAFQPKIAAFNALPTVTRPGVPVRIEPIITDADRDGPYSYYWCWTKDEQVFRANTPVLEVSFDLLNGETSREYEISLFVVDQAGNASFSNRTNVFITTENLPPIVRIVEPSASFIDVQVGDRVNFRAEATDPEGNVPLSYLWFLPDGSLVSTETVSYQFLEEGLFVVGVIVEDSLGNSSPQTQTILVNVVSAVDPEIPDTFILLPTLSSRIFTGESLILSGLIASSNTNLEGYWQIKNLSTNQNYATLQGNAPGRVKFSEPGLFQIDYLADFLGRPSPRTNGNSRIMAVYERGDDNNAPQLTYPESFQFTAIANGSAYTLNVNGSDPDGDPLSYRWFVEGELLTNQTHSVTLTTQIPDMEFSGGVAYESSLVTAVDDKGKPAREPVYFTVAVYNDRVPPVPEVNSLSNGSVVYRPFSQPYSLESQVENAQGLSLRYFWSIFYVDDLLNPIFSDYSGPTLPSLNLERPGLLVITLSVDTADGSLRNAYPHSHYLYAFNPSTPPEPVITKPITNKVVVEVGGSVTFEGLVSDKNLFVGPEDTFGFLTIDTQMIWEISQNGDLLTTIAQNEPLHFVFEQAGTFQVKLKATNSIGLEGIQTDHVQVQVIPQRSDESLEPNDLREIAADINIGNYGGLSVGPGDPVDWYRFTLEVTGAAVDFEFDLSQAADPAIVSVYLGEDRVAQSTLSAGKKHPFTFIGAKPGQYFLELRSVEGALSKRAVSFGVSLSVSNPRLVFTYPKTDEIDQTYLTLINPTQTEARATLIARSEKGESLAEAEMPLKANGHEEKVVSDIFPTVNPLDIAWVQVRSDQSIVGLSTTQSRDELSAMAEPAIIGSLDELIIPHIAQDTGVWFTQASLVNQGGDMVDARFRSTAGEFSLPDLENLNQGVVVDFEKFFNGTLPPGSEWGSVVEANSQTGLAGMEIFGTKNGSPRIAALNLGSERVRNPNFTYVDNNLYFPHIAEDRSNFFTGIAFVNIASEPVDIVLVGYSRQGEVLATSQRQLQGNEKVVALAEALFPDLPQGASLSWMELKTNGPVQGYTVFGDNRGTNSLLAGLTAIGGGAKEVIFQKILFEADTYWTGLAVVNVSATRTAQLTYQAFDGQGALLGTAQASIGPHQKDLNLVERLFDAAILPSVRWVRLTSDQPVAAFELFGDLAGNFLAGCVAQ